MLGGPHLATQNQNFEGFFISKGSIMFANTWYIHHDPNIWTEPWVFKQERFLDDAGKRFPLEDQVRRNVISFGFGRRECPGENFDQFRIFFYLTAVL